MIAVVERADAGPYEVAITGEYTADDDLLDAFEQGSEGG